MMVPSLTLLILGFLAFVGTLVYGTPMPCDGSAGCACNSACAAVNPSTWAAGISASKLFTCCVSSTCYCCEILTYLAASDTTYARDCAAVSAVAPAKCPCNCMRVTVDASVGTCPTRMDSDERGLLPIPNLNFTTIINPNYLDLSSLRHEL